MPKPAIEPLSDSWERTGVWHTEPCGCVYDQRVEAGVADYHEAWSLIVRCPRHALVGRLADG